MLNQKELKNIFAKYRFRPLKRFGGNYLVDGNIKNRIIESANVSKDDCVLEIGPGLGALKIDLAESGARVTAVEKDRKAFAILGDISGGKFPNLKLVNADILDFDFEGNLGPGRVKVVGNLPYYITTPLIEYLITNRKFIDSALIVIQKEVAARILACPGTRDYGSLSCFVQYYSRPVYLHTIKNTCFYPTPEVDSSLIRLDMPETPSVSVKNEELLFKIIRGAFNQRRKTIINSLSRPEVLDMVKNDLIVVVKSLGIDPAIRPESLTLVDFARITNSVSRHD